MSGIYKDGRCKECTHIRQARYYQTPKGKAREHGQYVQHILARLRYDMNRKIARIAELERTLQCL